MVDELREKVEERCDYKIISDLLPENSKLLDLGCGDGSLLKLLECTKGIDGLGVENTQSKILECVRNGVSVIHGDLNEGLVYFNDQMFDYIVLSQTLQAVNRPDHLLDEILRVGKRGIISFINMGYARARHQLMFTGRMPVTKTLPAKWYDTKNIHLATIKDFRELCRKKNITILDEIPIGKNTQVMAKLFPNFFASMCVFVVSRD